MYNLDDQLEKAGTSRFSLGRVDHTFRASVVRTFFDLP